MAMAYRRRFAAVGFTIAQRVSFPPAAAALGWRERKEGRKRSISGRSRGCPLTLFLFLPRGEAAAARICEGTRSRPSKAELIRQLNSPLSSQQQPHSSLLTPQVAAGLATKKRGTLLPPLHFPSSDTFSSSPLHARLSVNPTAHPSSAVCFPSLPPSFHHKVSGRGGRLQMASSLLFLTLQPGNINCPSGFLESSYLEPLERSYRNSFNSTIPNHSCRQQCLSHQLLAQSSTCAFSKRSSPLFQA